MTKSSYHLIKLSSDNYAIQSKMLAWLPFHH